ncbi:cytochrome c biogenesis protein ResB [Ornithinibacillus bavariensis]|uniref:Cytochrome c biogenesis protein n=1 Tax=Ornithinibacillus bavariensis TaxID=545502 RepID=A0A919XDG6_9BACI|nr:cytochrome c biogenesis protein ResB [Ornithinibacillus bavariensis]GIO28488.1 cytochrome c biogenesis protein [Ornithinibacillus bavariensis]
MNHIKCECGHVNPEGTVLCEACGKPIAENQHIDGNDKKKLLNMRYEGSARRSTTYNKTIIDKIWNFFSSVKVGVWLIVLALIASGIGTIFPQEQYIPSDAISRDPQIFYPETYGIFGKIFYQLGFHNLYSSWWYLILIALIGVSLVVCSLDRFVPLYKALKRQKPKRHETFINRQRFYSETDHVSSEDLNTVKERLLQQRYKITEEDGHIVAEKGRFSRWGPYVNHIGLIIILIAALLRITPFMYLNEYLWVREGEVKVVPGTDGEYYIENKEFVLDTYAEDDERFKDAIAKQGRVIPSNFQTNAIIYQAEDQEVIGAETKLNKITDDEISMNHPVKFGGYTLYQQGYQLNEFSKMTFKIYEMNDPDADVLGEFTVDLFNPKTEYKLDNGFKVEVTEYYPDYIITEDGISSKTKDSNNPAFVFKLFPPNSEESEISFVGNVLGAVEGLGIDPTVVELQPMGNVIGSFAPSVDPTGENNYRILIDSIDFDRKSGLSVKRDRTLPLFIIGALIFMIGVVQGMYWQHRRIWIHPKKQGILLAGHTNKNWFGLKKDIEKAIENTPIQMVKDQNNE